jgi:muramoyltetrapeptide carboxypeptidase
MAGAFNDGGAASIYIQSLKKALTGEPAAYECAPHPFNRSGTVTAPLVGGNLSLLAHGTGTPSDPDTKGAILFLEDVGEYLYNIDRMLYQLKRSGKLDRLAGLVIGGFSEMKDTQRPFGSSVEEIIRDVVKEYDYPVCFHFPVGHGRENLALKIGVEYRMCVEPGRVGLEEL